MFIIISYVQFLFLLIWERRERRICRVASNTLPPTTPPITTSIYSLLPLIYPTFIPYHLKTLYTTNSETGKIMGNR